VKIVFLESSPDCLRRNSGGNNVVDVMGSLDSIIKLSSSDLAKNGLFVTRGELGRTSTFVVLLITIHLLLDSSNCRLP